MGKLPQFVLFVQTGAVHVQAVRLILENGQSVCYTGVAANTMLKTVPAEVVAVEIEMVSTDTQYAISEIVVLAKN